MNDNQPSQPPVDHVDHMDWSEPPEAPDAGVKAAGYMIIAVTLAVVGLIVWGLWV